ncbi:MAG TPA: acetyl-CoA synthetase, partial [Gemmatimonadetes bacterium]|nr:acetyl-CoA synthetase [Gemmatimonadota bacterium]
MNLASATVTKWVEEGLEDPEAFWARAAQELPWFRTWDRIYEADPPTFRWFIGAETNIAHNALDHHVDAGRGQVDALIYFNERGDEVRYTYGELLAEVKQVAAALRGLGIGKGDRVTLSMPTCPEALMLMLACMRIGAIHSVVFAGFGAQALADRISASGSRFVFTADITYRRGKEVPLKPLLDDALRSVGDLVENVVVLQRSTAKASLHPERDIPWDAFLAGADGQSAEVEWMEANEPAFILATSGTTAKPKLAVHRHGGYQVHVAAMGRWCFGLEPEDVWWATSDIGWIVGHSYMVYGPLLIGCTTIVFEGALDFPTAEGNWRIAVEKLGATGIFTSPTAIRALMRYGDGPLQSVDHSKLQRIVSAGEVLNP